MKSTKNNDVLSEDEFYEDSADDVRDQLKKLCKCDRILSESEIPDFGEILKAHYGSNRRNSGRDNCRDDIESEFMKLNKLLHLPQETYSMTKIETNLPKCLKYGVRSGRTHMNMQKFSSLSRGYQGPATAVAAIATSFIVKPHCWNEAVIDQVVEDGDTFFTESYKYLSIDDRRAVTLLDLQPQFDIRNTHRAFVQIDEPLYAGTFRSETPRELHVAKALDLFFKEHDICVLTSSVLNVAIWKCCKHFNIFDAQPRFDDCEIDDSSTEGTAKLIFVENLAGVLFMILERSLVQNESYVLYKVSIINIKELSTIPQEPEVALEEPTLQPSGYVVPEKFRAIVQGSYHLHHPSIPREFHGRSHLVIALAAIVYSKLVSSSKWTRVMLDLIVNQAHIYLTDLARVLGKSLDESFDMSVSELLSDVVLGVYTAKIRVQENVVPGENAKGKLTMDVGIRNFFNANVAGVIELKKTFYAVWKDDNKYYLLDPFACDEEGFRVDPNDPEEAQRYSKATGCVSMNSSIDQLLELLLENTESKDKDPFVIHGIGVLYVKTGSARDGSDEKVIFREKGTNRRPEPPPSPPSTIVDECDTVVVPHPQPRPKDEGPTDYVAQYPELMSQVELYMDTFDTEGDNFAADVTLSYRVANPHRLILRATKNCKDAIFRQSNRGRQGLIVGLAALAKAQLKKETEWICRDVNHILVGGDEVYGKLVDWIVSGARGDPFGDPDDDNFAPPSKKDDLASSSRMTDDMFGGLNQMEFSMLPDKLNFYDEDVRVSWKAGIMEGEANPMVNLGEALECYFDFFDEMLLENNKLMYAIWRHSNKYFVLNPYGNDADGWRDTTEPAAVFVVDSINELVNLLYGLLEFNDHYFKFHYVKLNFVTGHESEEGDNAEDELDIQKFEKYKTKFLPVTEDDLLDMKPDEPTDEVAGEEGSLENGDGNGHPELDQEKKSVHTTFGNKSSTTTLSNRLEEVPEPGKSDTPERLNLALVTGIVKMELNDGQEIEESPLVGYEKLKYNHPPPFVTPPARNLCDLLGAKLASKSAHSLLSRFSIDSRLAPKEKNEHDVTISSVDEDKLITLPPKKYFFSKTLSSGLTPIRAVDQQYIRDKKVEAEREEECRRERKDREKEMVEQTEPDLTTEDCILPSLVVVGPCIMTPKFIPKPRGCPEQWEKVCPLTEKEQEDIVLRKLICSTENLLLEVVLPDFKECTEKPKKEDEECPQAEKCPSIVREPDDGNGDSPSEVRGFGETDDELVGIILGGTSLLDRETVEPCHYKSCYFSAILCVLAKINVDVADFHGGFLDRMIAATDKIADATGKLRYKMTRCFRNFNILGARCNVIVKQARFANPECHAPDAIGCILPEFLEKHRTGIVVFGNAAYAFWANNARYYLFDPYPCDENGRAAPEGRACLMQICDLDAFLTRLIDNTGEPANQSYRLYTIAISHLEHIKKRKPPKRKKKKPCEELSEEEEEPVIEECGPQVPDKSESETSLIELADWVNKEKAPIPPYDDTCPGFSPIKNYNASAIEVPILENDITRPILAPFKCDPLGKPSRIRPYDRKFYENSVLAEPMDLCIMAWAQIYEPPAWSTRTVRALFEASREYAFDSLLAAEDTTVVKMSDDLLTEFNIANYNFRVNFSPMHPGVLYADEGWNLAMSLEKIFDSVVYTGAVLVCGDVHVGVMKKKDKFYAWWPVLRTKNIRMIVSDDMEEYLRLVVKEINEPEEVDFEMRVITISYAKIYGPDCSDLEGLHESMMPSSSLAKIHVKDRDPDYDAIFRPIDCPKKSVLTFGTVALNDRDTVIEPYVKRCYFVALFAVMLKRDVIQNPLPGMVDRVLEIAECVYKLFEQPKYHTEHILRNVCLLGRLFEFRDCASELVCLQGVQEMTDKNFIATVRKHLKQYFKKCTSGIIHFSNCCYGFWYSKAKCCYYYLDPYQCDEKGIRVCSRGKSCLFMFPTICEMVQRMCANSFEETTGFFIHQIHVESVDSSACPKFKEDPMWIYLDYHWSYMHVPKQKNNKNKEAASTKEIRKPMYKNYLIEVPNSIYSIWGTLSTFDTKFGSHAGKTQAAICVAALAMQNLCHPSEWSSIVLDSIVVCGDSYYKDSQKIPTQCRNQFDLTDCFKISPYLWDLYFAADMCGVLYCSDDQPNLMDCLENNFERSENLLLRCSKKFVAIMKTTEAFYVVDPSWTGPPLFCENHGAIYAIRTRNINMLVYVVTKMLNTNHRVEFIVTPVNLSFKDEPCQAGDSKPKINRKKLLDKPARQSPGTTVKHPCLVNGCEAVPGADYYLEYSKNLKFGLKHGAELECAPEISRELRKKPCGKKTCGKKESSARKCQTVCASKAKAKSTRSITSILNKTVGYPKILNLIKDIPEECFPDRASKHYKYICGMKKELPLGGTCDKLTWPDQAKKEVDLRGSFVHDEEREMFQKYNDEFDKTEWFSYKHGQKGPEKFSPLASSSRVGSASGLYVTSTSIAAGSHGDVTKSMATGSHGDVTEGGSTADTKTYKSEVNISVKE